MSRPLVSVVIAVYDEARHIERCLRTLLAQTYQPLELVVVDDGSTDGTPELVDAVPGVELVRQAHLGAAAARNAGAARSSGEVLVFLDGDMAFPPEFVERLVVPIVEGGSVGTFTKEILVANTERRWARAHQLGRGLPVDSHFRDDFPDRWEIFRAIRRDAFERVGGFDEIGHGEDVTLGRKLGELADVAPGAVCHHYEPDTLGDIFRSAVWLGRGERFRETGRRGRHLPWRSARLGVRLARQHRMPSLLLYRLVWDTGVLFGATTRDRASVAK